MARVQGNELLLEPYGGVNAARLVDGAAVTITLEDGTTPATVYAAATGGATVTQPLASQNGMVVASGGGEWWLEPGVYVRKATHADGRVLDPLRIEAYSGVDSARLTSAESRIAVVQESPVNVKDSRFGATGDGTTDDLAAITAAIAHANTSPGGGEVLFPSRSTYIAHGISLDGLSKISLIGEGDPRQTGARILSHSTGSTPVVSAAAMSGGEIKGLRIENDQAAYSGVVLDASRGAGANDTSLVTIERNYLRAVSQAGSAVTLLKLAKATAMTIENNRLYGGKYQILGRTVGTDYSNIHTIRENYFELADTMAIRNPGAQWNVEDNTFEALRGGVAGAVSVDTAVGGIAATWPALVLKFTGNDCLDATAGAGVWVDYAGFVLNAIANTFDSAGALAGDGIRFLDNVAGGQITGNKFHGLTNGINLNGKSLSGFLVGGNRYTAVTTPINGNTWGTGSLVLDSDGYLIRQDANTLQVGNNLNLNAGTTNRILQQALTAATQFVHQVRAAADSQDRYELQGTGKMSWGPGGATVPDTTWERSQAGVMKLGNALQLTAMAAASVPNNSIFLDSADNVIKKKDNAGTVTVI